MAPSTYSFDAEIWEHDGEGHWHFLSVPMEVADDIERATELGITAVPTYVINGQWSIPGAQDTDTFVTVLRRLHERITVEPAPACDDDVCDA